VKAPQTTLIKFDKTNSASGPLHGSSMALIAHSFVMTGRIEEGGNLQCSYHGWMFDGAAKCLEIPQAEKEGPQAKVRARRKDAAYF
jgi:hypothetical protein